MTKSGIAMVIVIIIITILFISVFSIMQLMRGVGSQMEYSDSHIRGLAIAESGIQWLISRLMAHPWEERWFREAPDYHNESIKLDGGGFVYIIQDTTDIPMSADIWIRGEYKNTKRLIFYRVKYEDLLFKGLTNPTHDFTATLEDQNPQTLTGGSMDDLVMQVNQKIDKKRKTGGYAASAWDRMADQVNPLLILRQLNANLSGEIQEKSRSDDGEFTDVARRSKDKPPAGGKSTIKNYDQIKIIDWINKQGFDGEMAAYLAAVARSNFKKIDDLVKKEKYLEAEQVLKKLLNYLYTTAASVNSNLLMANARYRQALDLLEKEARAGNWTQSRYDQRKSELYQAYLAERTTIIKSSEAPSG